MNPETLAAALRTDLERITSLGIDLVGPRRHVGRVVLWAGSGWPREYYLVPKDGGGYACVPARPGSAR